MIMYVKTLIIAIMICLLPTLAYAADYTVRPFLIDTEVDPRDIESHIVKITNSSEYTKYVFYATVNEISVDAEGEIKEFVTPVMTDQTTTVTSWIEVTRGRIEVPPGESREVPITINIQPNAVPGEYHAFVGFVAAPNRPTAEATARAGEADGVLVKVTVADQRQDSLHLSSFSVGRLLLNSDSHTAAIDLENVGDLAAAPSGEIVFYNSRGEEVAATPVTAAEASIAPGDRATLEAALPASLPFGRIKANLKLDYGENQRAALHDTTFFFVVPTYVLLLISVAILLITLLLFMLIRRTFLHHHDHDGTEEVTMFVKDGHDGEPQDHDINLKSQ